MFHSCKYNFLFHLSFLAAFYRDPGKRPILFRSMHFARISFPERAFWSTKISRMTSERENEARSNDNIIPRRQYKRDYESSSTISNKNAGKTWIVETIICLNQSVLCISFCRSVHCLCDFSQRHIQNRTIC